MSRIFNLKSSVRNNEIYRSMTISQSTNASGFLSITEIPGISGTGATGATGDLGNHGPSVDQLILDAVVALVRRVTMVKEVQPEYLDMVV